MAPNVTYVLPLSVKQKRKKKKPLPDVIYIFFPSSASLVLYLGKNCSHHATLRAQRQSSYERQL